MAKHEIYGVGPTMFDSFARASAGAEIVPFYVTASEFGVLNSDGTRTYFHGEGLVYDWETAELTGGTVTSIVHFDASGAPLDQVVEVNYDAARINHFFQSPIMGWEMSFANLNFNAGINIDATMRVGGAVVDDVITGGFGDDVIFGGSGNDRISGNGGKDRLYGQSGNDLLAGNIDNDRIWGGNGADLLDGNLGQDYLNGGSGADVLFGNRGAKSSYDGAALQPDSDTLVGGAGNDVLWGGSGADLLQGDTGADTAIYFGLFSELLTSRTADGFTVTAFEGVDFGSAKQYATDILAGVERIATNDGTFVWREDSQTWVKISEVSGVEAASVFYEKYIGSTGADTLSFGSGQGGTDSRYFNLRGGNDTVTFADLTVPGSYLVDAGNGNDKITVSGGGEFHLNGGAGRDDLKAGSGRDYVYGDSGDDVINGGLGNDVLSGGEGNDIFVFETVYGRAMTEVAFHNMPGNDVILDFQIGNDKLDLNTSIASITNTNDGILITLAAEPLPDIDVFQAFFGGRTILLKGINGNLNIEDILL